MMNQRRTRIVAAVAVAALVTAIGVTVAVLRGGSDNGPAAEQSTFCWRTLKRGEVAKLSVYPLKRYASDDGDLKGTIRADCQVGAGLEHGVMKQLQFWLSVGGSPQNGDVWYMADDVAGVSPFRAPIPGVPGWVNKRMAGVLLPASCDAKLKFGTPLYVRLEMQDDQDKTWSDGTLQKRMTDVLMTAATRLTRQLGCSDPTFKVPATTPHLLEKQTPTAGKACGLPGFSVPAKYTEEYVTDGDFRLWSCSLGPDESDDPVKNGDYFTVTQDPYLVRLNQSEPDRWSTTLKCDGKQTLVQAGTDDEALARNFRAAVARKAHCT